MQFIFITLLAANILLAVWLGFFSDAQTPNGVVQYQHGGAGQRLVLLEELSVKQADDLGVERKLLDLQSLTPAQGQLSTTDKCTILGPFVNKNAARDMVASLRRSNVMSSVESMVFPAGVGHWVYLPPFGSRREALDVLTSLQERKIDSYIVPKGENKNAISLGMFTKQNLAQAQFKKMRALSFDAELKTVQRTYNELWVMIKHQQDEKINGTQWVELLKMKKNIKKRKNFCLGVALEY